MVSLACISLLSFFLRMGLSEVMDPELDRLSESRQMAFKSAAETVRDSVGERLRMQEHPWGVVSPMAGVMPKRFGRRREDADEAISLIKEYQVVVPDALVLASQVLHSSSNCTNLLVSLHQNTVTTAMLFRPSWIEKSPSVGSCPTQYSVKRLGPHFNPPALLEAQCTCESSTCSREGHQCVPVTKQVPVWRKFEGMPRQITLQEVTVACACILRPGLMADFIAPSWITK